MEVVSDIGMMQARAEAVRLSGKRIAIVPTMGALHNGHLSLIRTARNNADVVVTTVFVNPTQFGPDEDFRRYPRDPERDARFASEAGSSIVFMPDEKAMYPPGFLTNVQTDRVAATFEGAIRPTHFRGVTTVVAKLFHIVRPHVAVFGQKDIQQAFIIRRMIRDLNFDIELIVSPIVREEDGLAMSSRNVYLSASERKGATSLIRALRKAVEMAGAGEKSLERIRKEMMSILEGGKPSSIDYIAFLNPETFDETSVMPSPSLLIALAARFGATRLLDNVVIQVPGQ